MGGPVKIGIDKESRINGSQILGAIQAADRPVTMLHEDPMVAYIDDFVTEEECAHIIEVASGRMKRASVAGDKAGVFSDGRTNTVAWLPHDQTPELKTVAERVARLMGVPLFHAENFQVIHYGTGAQYKAHFDAFDASMERGKRNMARGGQRITTTLCYLNTVEGGGGTGFPKLSLEVQAVKGRLVAFNNCEGATLQRTPLSLHAGLPVESGEKWAFNLWFRSAPANLTIDP